jgi:hypothetical protein
VVLSFCLVVAVSSAVFCVKCSHVLQWMTVKFRNVGRSVTNLRVTNVSRFRCKQIHSTDLSKASSEFELIFTPRVIYKWSGLCGSRRGALLLCGWKREPADYGAGTAHVQTEVSLTASSKFGPWANKPSVWKTSRMQVNVAQCLGLEWARWHSLSCGKWDRTGLSWLRTRLIVGLLWIQ